MNTKQIAEEAARQIAGKLKHANVTSLWIEDIIHAAIEKVDEQWRERFRKFEKIEEKFGPASQRAAHASEPSDQIAAAAERLRYECETTEDPNSGFAKDIMTLVEFAESRAAQASEVKADTKRLLKEAQKYVARCIGEGTPDESDAAFKLTQAIDAEMSQAKEKQMNTKQIAEEARNEIRRYFNKPYYPNEYGNDKVLLIIQSAIEKAMQAEPWTVNTILQICDNAGVMLPTDDEAKAIADAHNATLQPAHATSGGNRFTCPRCGLEPAHASEIPRSTREREPMNTKQIGAEAREQIFNAIHFSATERQERITESLIQAAIEKATLPLIEQIDFLQKVVDQRTQALLRRATHASDPGVYPMP